MALSVLLRAVDHISGPVKRVQTRLGAFRRQAQAIGRRVGFERLTGSLARAGSAARDLYVTAGRVARRLALIGTVGVAAITGATVATASMGDQTAKTADKLGIGIERLQEMRYAAERAGLSSQTLDMAVQRFTRRVSEAAQGSGEAVGALEELGLSAEALADRTPDQALAIVADALKNVESQSDRVRLAFKLFDSEGVAMVNMLRDGSDGLEHMYARARELGYVIGEDTARQAERFSDQMLDMRKSMLGVRTIIGSALMPVFGQWMEQLTELVVRYQPQIQAWVQNFAAELPGRVAQLKAEFLSLVDSLQPAIELGAALVERFGAVHTAAAALGVIIGGPLIVPLLKMVVALGSVGLALGQVSVGLIGLAAKAIPMVVAGLKTLAVAAMAHPVVAIVAAIAAGAALLIANWDTVGPWFRNLWASVTGYVGEAWGKLTDWLGWDPLAVLRPVWDALTGYVGEVMGAVKRLFTGDWTAIQDLFKWSPLGLLQQGFGAALDYLGSIDWREAAAAGWEALKTLFRWSPMGLLVQGFGRATDWLGEQDWAAHGRALLETLAGGIRSMASAPVDAVRGALSRLRNLLPFSDAREGPLSALTASGRAIPGTLAEGIEAGRGAFLDTVTSVVGAARDALSGAWDRVKGWFGGGGDQEGEVRVRAALGELPELPELEGQARYRVSLGDAPTLPELRGRAWYEVLLGALPTLPVLESEARYRTVLGELPTLPELRGRALFVAEVVGMGRMLDALRGAATLVPPALQGAAANDAAASLPEPALGGGGERAPAAMASARGGVQVQRIDFRPEVTIQVSDAASAREIADIVDERLERMRSRDLWVQVQGVQEAAG